MKTEIFYIIVRQLSGGASPGDRKILQEWLAESSDTREIFDLPSAVEFAARFFVPLAQHCRQAA